jgi:hypothetical protein
MHNSVLGVFWNTLTHNGSFGFRNAYHLYVDILVIINGKKVRPSTQHYLNIVSTAKAFSVNYDTQQVTYNEDIFSSPVKNINIKPIPFIQLYHYLSCYRNLVSLREDPRLKESGKKGRIIIKHKTYEVIK